jgi:hypothetical protein
MRRLLLVAAAAITAGVVAVSASATTPPGAGLYGDHISTCSGIFDYGPAPVTLVPGSGSTFWVAGHHLLIQSFQYKYDGTSDWLSVSFGNKTGKMTDPMEVCQGHFDGNPGYSIISYSLVIP